MKNSFAYAVAALLACLTVAASAQSCHTVRDAQGKIVYQSIRPPVDTTVPYKDEIEALFPGGYMQIDHDFFRCGSYERPAPTALVAPTAKARALGQDSVSARPPGSTADDFGDYAKHVPRQKAANIRPNLFEDLIPKAATEDAPGGIFTGLRKEGESAPAAGQMAKQATDTPVAQAPPATQSPSDNSFGAIMPKVLAAGLIVGILCLPKRARNVTLSVLAGAVVLAIGFAVYESAHPSTLPFAQCVIDNVPAVRNDVAARAAASQCVDLHGGYNSVAAKRYLKGQAIGFMTPKSRAECVTKYASDTASEMAAKLVYGACDCLYQSPSEGAGETSYSCG